MMITGLILGLIFPLMPGTGIVDPYYTMEAHNLNTMNSYFVPSTLTPQNISGDINLVDYVHQSIDLKNPSLVLTNSNGDSNNWSVVHLMSSYFGVLLQLIVFLCIGLIYKFYPSSRVSLLLGMVYDEIYGFFDDIMGNRMQYSIKLFIVGMFFTILIANLLGWIGDVVRFFFPWWLRNITAGTGELEFTVALAIIGSILILVVQARNLGGRHKVLHEFIPITGKGLMENKIADIGISLFMGILDTVGFFARIISLSLRLFGNMSAGSILLNVSFLGLSAVTMSLIGLNLPIGIPLIVYIQGLLSVFIQALVFTLIVAISARMASD